MQTQEAKVHPGYGILYPDGVSGIKVRRTYTEGPHKVINPDGSIAYSTPSPTIHELVSGAFTYADGSPVKKREHLEALPDGMREKALDWFDGKTAVLRDSAPAPVKQDKKDTPDPIWVIPAEGTLLDQESVAQFGLSDPYAGNTVTLKVEKGSGLSQDDRLDAILSGVNALAGIIQKQGEMIQKHREEISKLKERPVVTPRLSTSAAKHKKQSEAMKAKWADPEYRTKMLSKIPKRKDGNNATETSEEV